MSTKERAICNRRKLRGAHASRVWAKPSRVRELSSKLVSARRRNQHARRARSPDCIQTAGSAAKFATCSTSVVGSAGWRPPLLEYCSVVPSFQLAEKDGEN